MKRLVIPAIVKRRADYWGSAAPAAELRKMFIRYILFFEPLLYFLTVKLWMLFTIWKGTHICNGFYFSVMEHLEKFLFSMVRMTYCIDFHILSPFLIINTTF